MTQDKLVKVLSQINM